MTDKKTADPQASQNTTQTPASHANTASARLPVARHDAGATFLDIRKSDSERLRINVSEYRGRTFLDLRCWYSVDSGEYKPGRAGVTIRPDQVAEIVQGLLLAVRAIDPQGAR